MEKLWNSEDIIQGDRLLLYLTSGKKVLAYATSCSIQVDSETVDTSSKFSCRWSSAKVSRSSYTISADALYCSNENGISFDQLLEMMVDGEPVEWYMGEEAEHTGACDENPHTLDTSKPYYNGQAVVTSCSLSAGNNEAASCSITLTGFNDIQKNGQQI